MTLRLRLRLRLLLWLLDDGLDEVCRRCRPLLSSIRRFALWAYLSALDDFALFSRRGLGSLRSDVLSSQRLRLGETDLERDLYDERRE